MIEYNKGTTTATGWTIISQQEDFVDPTKIKQNYLYDTNNNKTIGFLDWIDQPSTKDLTSYSSTF